jgi:hypothetical protein
MEQGVADRGIGADIGKLAQALDAQRVHLVVFLRQHDDLDAADVGIHRDQVFRQVGIDEARRPLVDLRRLMQRR